MLIHSYHVIYRLPLILTHCCALPDKHCLSHGMLPLSGYDDIAFFE